MTITGCEQREVIMATNTEKKIIKFNKKLETLITKFTDNVYLLSANNQDLFPHMTIDDFAASRDDFKKQLMQIMIMNSEDVEDVAKTLDGLNNVSNTDNSSNVKKS